MQGSVIVIAQRELFCGLHRVLPPTVMGAGSKWRLMCAGQWVPSVHFNEGAAIESEALLRWMLLCLTETENTEQLARDI